MGKSGKRRSSRQASTPDTKTRSSAPQNPTREEMSLSHTGTAPTPSSSVSVSMPSSPSVTPRPSAATTGVLPPRPSSTSNSGSGVVLPTLQGRESKEYEPVQHRPASSRVSSPPDTVLVTPHRRRLSGTPRTPPPPPVSASRPTTPPPSRPVEEAKEGTGGELEGLPTSPLRKYDNLSTVRQPRELHDDSDNDIVVEIDESTRTVDLLKHREASPTSPTQLSSGESHRRGKLVRREFSLETIDIYRKVVQPDNDVHYLEFERLMATPACAVLAHVVTKFTEQAVRSGAPMTNSKPYVEFMAKCMEMIYAIPESSLSSDRRAGHPPAATSSADCGGIPLECPSTAVILGEGVERYVTTKLYKLMFKVVPEDEHLHRRFRELQHLTAAELDAILELEDHHLWSQSMFELEAMRFFKTPREKLKCALRSLHLLQEAMKDIFAQRRRAAKGSGPEQKTRESGDGKLESSFGADQLLPCFMLLVLRASPTNFYANVQYVLRYRTSALCSPEESYCTANLESAAEFWLQCDHTGHLPPPEQGASLGQTKELNASGSTGRRSPSPTPTTYVPSLMLTLFGRARTSRPAATPATTTTLLSHTAATTPAKQLVKGTAVSPPLRDATRIGAAVPSPAPAALPTREALTESNSGNPTEFTEVQRWLVEDNLPFDVLTIQQLRAIVKLTRNLLQ